MNTDASVRLRADDVERIAREHMMPLLGRDDPGSGVNRDLIKSFSTHGLMSPFFARQFGGTGDGGVSATLLCQYREGLARVSPQASTALATQIGGIFVVARHATEAVRREWVPKVVSGEVVTALALTEPERGSDVASMTMPAKQVPGGWLLSGRKVWIMKAPDADIYTVFARTSGSGARGITGFLVPKGAIGFSAEPIDSLWPDRVGNLFFEDVFVPDSHVLGPVDEGFKQGMAIFDAFRPSVGAHILGIARTALDVSVRYANERRAFGHLISDFQAVSHLLAEMATRLEAARLLTYEAAAAYDKGETARVKSASAMAKLFASEAGQYIVDSAIQVHGAVALQKGHVLEHFYREVRASRIYEGTSQIQREIIARSLLSGHR